MADEKKLWFDQYGAADYGASVGGKEAHDIPGDYGCGQG